MTALYGVQVELHCFIERAAPAAPVVSDLTCSPWPRAFLKRVVLHRYGHVLHELGTRGEMESAHSVF